MPLTLSAPPLGAIVSGTTSKFELELRPALLVAVTDCAPDALAPAPDHA